MAESSTIRELLTRFGLTYEDEGFKLLDADVGRAMSQLGTLAGMLAGGVVGKAIIGWTREIADAADAVEKMSDSIGVGQEELQKWQYAADLAGVGNEELVSTFRKLQKNADAAANGGKEQAESFRRLGVDVRGANGELKSAPQLLWDISDGLTGVTNESERTALLMATLGKQGPRMANLLKGGSQGLHDMMLEAEQLGVVMDEEVIERSVEFNDDISRLTYTLRGFKIMLAREVLPILDGVIKFFIKHASAVAQFVRGTNLMRAALALLGVAAALFGARALVAFAGPIAIFLKWALIVGVLVAVFDELITTWEGGDTVLKRIIDKLFGPGSTAEAIATLKELGSGLAQIYSEQVYPAMERFGEDSHRWMVQLVEDASSAAEALGPALSEAVTNATDDWNDAVEQWLAGLDMIKNGFREVAKFLGIQLPELPGEKPQTNRDGSAVDTRKFRTRGDYRADRAVPYRPAFDATAPANQPNAVEVNPVVRVPLAAPGGTTIQQSNRVELNVHGAQDPRAVAAEAERAVTKVLERSYKQAADAHRQVGSNG